MILNQTDSRAETVCVEVQGFEDISRRFLIFFKYHTDSAVPVTPWSL